MNADFLVKGFRKAMLVLKIKSVLETEDLFVMTGRKKGRRKEQLETS